MRTLFHATAALLSLATLPLMAGAQERRPAPEMPRTETPRAPVPRPETSRPRTRNEPPSRNSSRAESSRERERPERAQDNAQSGRDRATVRERQPDIPREMMPPTGKCRIWMDGVPAAQQPAPTDCRTALRQRTTNGVVVFGPTEKRGVPLPGFRSQPRPAKRDSVKRPEAEKPAERKRPEQPAEERPF